MENKMYKSMALMFSIACFGFACSSNSSDNASDTSPQETVANNGNEGNTPDATVSENTDPTPTNTNNNQSANDDGGTAVKEPTNQVECIAACEAKYPTAAADNHELDNTCFFGVCGNVCDNLGQGESKYPSADAGSSCDTTSAGSWPIGVPQQSCADCLATTPTCCTLWIKIFASAEGQGLSNCAQTCWNKFQQ